MTARRRLIGLWSVTAILALTSLAVAITATIFFARSWLCAFVLISMVPIGSLALLMVHGITGGRWGTDIAPALVPAARTMPLLLIAVLPILILRPLIYQWHAPADVAQLYLNPPFFDIRSLAALTIWSGFAWGGIWRKPLSAALGLVVHLILVSLIPADWILTIQPGSTSAGFGLGFGIEQIFASLAFVALLAPQGRDLRANRDLAGLLVTALLGTLYFVFMQFIVIWYGNIPAKAGWYIARTGGAWPALAFAGFVMAGAIPFLGVLNSTLRRSPAALRVLGASALIGIAFHVAWLTAPAFGAPVLVPALLGAATMLAFLVAGAEQMSIAEDRDANGL